MKNAIVFTAGGARYAIELRWIRDVIALGHITPVPRGPAAIAGVVNVRGAIVTVLDLPALLETAGDGVRAPSTSRRTRPGDGAVLLDVEGMRAAIAVDTVQTVMTLSEPPPGIDYIDHRGRPLALLDPAQLLRAASADTQAAAARLTAQLTEEPT